MPNIASCVNNDQDWYIYSHTNWIIIKMVQMMDAFILLALMLPLSTAVEQFVVNDNLDLLYSTYSVIELRRCH